MTGAMGGQTAQSGKGTGLHKARPSLPVRKAPQSGCPLGVGQEGLWYKGLGLPWKGLCLLILAWEAPLLGEQHILAEL